MSDHDKFDGNDNDDESMDEPDGEMDDNFLFNSIEFTSGTIKSEMCTIDENIIQFHHSFGYDCYSKMFNLCAVDDHTVVYAAGSYICVLDTKNGSLSFRKCVSNGTIGHIAKNSVFGHLAVGENCENPLIVIYEWPKFKIIRVLKGCSKKQINWLTYSQNGKYLCSQGGGPDHTITIWDWKKSKILLKTKSHTQDVYVCRFSDYIPNHIVTAGSGHIKFWKMVKTFTGLKLKGWLGRFGKTEISNVIGVLSMPDEKVISGCEWGNMLIWDEEHIHMQVTSYGRNPCHLGPIIMLLYSKDEMELTTIGMDGMIKFWDYRMVDKADPPENDRVLERESFFTIKVQDSIGAAKIMGVCKTNDQLNSNEYFIQDGNGGLWLTHMKQTMDYWPPKRLAKFHGDVITSLQASPVGYFIATTSLDGWFHVYDVPNRKLIFTHNFELPITSSVWLPSKIVNTANVFVLGFKTGILKTVAVRFGKIIGGKNPNPVEIQISKPHTDSIRYMIISHSARILVCGSDDCSIFAYKIETGPVKLNPIGMYTLPGKATFIHWKPSEKHTALISCASGHIMEVKIPTSRPLYTKESFALRPEPRTIGTVSVKSEIIRDRFVAEVERRKKEKIDQKTEQLNRLREDNPGVEIDEELFFEDSDEEEEPPEIYIPPTPNPVLFAVYAPAEKSVWVSIDGYDSGFLYEYDFDRHGPIDVTEIPDKDGTPLTAFNTFGTNPMYVLMGFADGRVRITKVKDNNTSDWKDYIEYALHDNVRGKINALCFSHDKRIIYTYGDDGNIFSLAFQSDNRFIDHFMDSNAKLLRSPELSAYDIIKTDEDIKLSLEERKINRKNLKASIAANKEKNRIYCLLYGLKERFKQVLITNQSLPESVQFPYDYFQFDERITNFLEDEAQSEMDELKSKLSFDYEKSLLGFQKVKKYFVQPVITDKFEVKAVLNNIGVKTIYHKERYNVFAKLLDEFLSKKHPKRDRRKTIILVSHDAYDSREESEIEIFLRNVHKIYSTLPVHIQRAIDKFTARKDIENQKVNKIIAIENEKSGISNSDRGYLMLNNIKATLGDLNLKSSLNFKPSDEKIVSMEDKFLQYMDVLDEIYKLKSDFNEQVIDLRQRKIKLVHDYVQFKFDVSVIQNELNDPETITPIDFPEVTIDDSIDPKLIESFEPIYISNESMYLTSKKCNLYSEISKRGYYDEPTFMKTTLQQMRKEHLKYKHLCFHETMSTKINMFDERLLLLKRKRIDVLLQITFLDLFATTLEEELLIFNDYDLLEDDCEYNMFVRTGIQNEKAKEIQSIRDDIKYYQTTIDWKKKLIADIRNDFDRAVQHNEFSKHLRKIFEKKFKLPKDKSGHDEDSVSSSSSDESDDDESGPDENASSESLTAMRKILVFDENIRPEGCDPELFALTFDLRSKRHEIEQYIDTMKKQIDSSNTVLLKLHVELEAIEYDLQKTVEELEEHRIKKHLALNEVETTIILKTSQLPTTKILKNSILVYDSVYNSLINRVSELKKENEQTEEACRKTNLATKIIVKEMTEMKNTLSKYKVDLKNQILNKFKIKAKWKFIDTMEMNLIKYMILEANALKDNSAEQFTKEITFLKKQINAHQEILSDSVRLHSVKTMALRALCKGIHDVDKDLIAQQKHYEKAEDMPKENHSVDDMDSLKIIYDILLKQKADILMKIKSMS